MAKKRKTAKDYFRSPTKTCANWVFKKQQSEIPPSVGDEGSRKRLTKKWLAIQFKYRDAKKKKYSVVA